ncbi:choice-of-anchor I family protein [Caldibacillus lycopersici]|uniref:Choice-of-anchor I family protein n=1 Tax=Perspicuibacillus lycopersici TaxID=1325689 RepID=A0AAE3LU04_9BACI|nr:choice-of-anchor I family protein [Perspicuibacillus lycopersici]MCU9614863.1 choice-of-anchor I family protein [Perspicuibacillus lycopersici]
MKIEKKKFTTLSKVTLVGALLFSTIPFAAAAKQAIPDTVAIKKIAGYSTGLSDKDGGVAEIVKYNPENKKFYVINGKSQTIDIVSLQDLTSTDSVQNLQKEKSINIGDAVNTDTFHYGDMTSIALHNDLDIIVAAVQDEDYSKQGKLVVMNYDGEIEKVYDAGVQPDMVTITKDGKYILSADEAEPRQGLEEGVDPEGSVSIVDVSTGEVTYVKFSNQSVIDDDVFIRNNGTKADAVHDFEPEYITVSSDNRKAYVTLQENNAIATIDIKEGKVLAVKSLGYKDHSLPGNELDAARNDKIELERLPILGAYMPDGIASYNVGGVEYLVTANEGDATEWEEFVNIADLGDVKDQLHNLNPNLFQGMTPEEAEAAFDKILQSGDYDKLEVLTDRGNDAIYTLGGRSVSIWRADTMEQVFDSGSDFEKITAERLPDYFNWSNDDDAFEKRSTKKGPEPEDVKVGIVNGEVYAFVGLERIGGVMTYNITNPSEAKFANYINTRDFSDVIAGDVAPEGLEFVSAEASTTGRPLIIVGNEVSGTVAVYEMQAAPIKLIESITLNQTTVDLKVGETFTLSATIQPAETTESKEVVWSSSDDSIATVTPSGEVTAIAAGSTEIAVATVDGKHVATATITVTEREEVANKPEQTPEETAELPEAPEEHSEGQKLPNTATNHYQLLIIGSSLLIISGIAYVVIWKRKSLA